MERLVDLETNRPVHIVPVEPALLRSGRGNSIFATQHWQTDSPTPFLYKEYASDDAEVVTRVDRLVRLLKIFPKIRSAVPGLPLLAVRRESGSGVVLHHLSGVPLEKFSGLQVLPLAQRLKLATDLATSVAILHGHGLLHTDLTAANILVDATALNRPGASVIDLDLVAAVDNEGWVPRFEPRSSPDRDSPFLAPELVGEVSQPSVWTDRWSLAVALHHLLLNAPFLDYCATSITMRQYSPVSTDFTGPHRWPSPEQSDEAEKHSLHRQQLNLLGPTLKYALIDTFDQTSGSSSVTRLSASEWLNNLTSAQRYTYRCTTNGCLGKIYGFVAPNRVCPVCQAESGRRDIEIEGLGCGGILPGL